MIRDRFLRLVFIPLLGIVIPIVAGTITYKNYVFAEIIAAFVYFIFFISAMIWVGCNWIHVKMRPLYHVNTSPFFKIASVSAVCAAYGAALAGILTMIWMRISREAFSWTPVYKTMLFCTLAVIIFTLMYEILFLSKERELDTEVVNELDRELSHAELQVLKNELEPHFIFNSLNTLAHLITTAPEQAYAYNMKLAQVYKYFLINKDRELISLAEELEFIGNYYFLLQIRYDDKMKLTTLLNNANPDTIKLPPCSLQLLLENAIKHNEFSDNNPLHIIVAMNEHYLKVSNNTTIKTDAVTSMGIGLQNLHSRYRLLGKKDIIIEQSRETFTVKLPLIN